MRNQFLLFIISLLTIQTVHSQGPYKGTETAPEARIGHIKGIINDSTSAGAIEYATVGLYRRSDASLVSGTITDQKGVFELKNLPFGEYYLEAAFIGYAKKQIPISLLPGHVSIDLGVISLHPDITHLDEVTVVAQSNQVEYKIDKKVVSVAQDIAASGGTLANVLENTPSVQVDVEGNVLLRGSGSFQLLIDGKPSVIQGSDGLQQIPASAVQSIEIITSPSAKFDPDGAAGIINVIMKKQKNAGIGGIVNFSAGTRDKYTADFLLNYRKNKLNFFVGGEYSNQNNYMNGETDRRTFFNDTSQIILSGTDGKFTRQALNLKTGFDYSINDLSSISLSGVFGNRNFARDFTSTNHWYTDPASIDSFYTDESISADEDLYYNLNADYMHKFDEEGHTLQTSLYYTASVEEETEAEWVTKTNSDYNPVNADPYRTRSSTTSPESNLRFELDYIRPVKRGKVELGLQSRWDNQEADYIYEDFQPLDAEWVFNDTISNSLQYADALQSVYGMYSTPLGKFEYQVGLRAEYDNRRLDQETTSESYTYEKIHLFPSFYMTRKLPDAHQLQFTFTTRIQRPGMRDLNPFIEYRGVNSIFYGNPALNPEFVNAYELNYQYTIKMGSLSLETYYRRTSDKITRITGVDTISGQQVFYNTVTNADKDNSLGMELMTNLNLAKWWQLSVTGNIFRYQLTGEVEGNELTSVATTWRTNFNSTFKLKWDTRLQITGFYNGPSNTLQGKREGFFVTTLLYGKI